MTHAKHSRQMVKAETGTAIITRGKVAQKEVMPKEMTSLEMTSLEMTSLEMTSLDNNQPLNYNQLMGLREKTTEIDIHELMIYLHKLAWAGEIFINMIVSGPKIKQSWNGTICKPMPGIDKKYLGIAKLVFHRSYIRIQKAVGIKFPGGKVDIKIPEVEYKGVINQYIELYDRDQKMHDIILKFFLQYETIFKNLRYNMLTDTNLVSMAIEDIYHTYYYLQLAVGLTKEAGSIDPMRKVEEDEHDALQT